MRIFLDDTLLQVNKARMTLRISLVLTSLSLMMVGCMDTPENEMFFSFNQKHVSASKSSGFYVRGHLRDSQFIADSEVLGDDDFGKSGQPGWMELSDGAFYPMHTARSPRSPYVRGYLTPNGFKPESREVR